MLGQRQNRRFPKEKRAAFGKGKKKGETRSQEWFRPILVNFSLSREANLREDRWSLQNEGLPGVSGDIGNPGAELSIASIRAEAETFIQKSRETISTSREGKFERSPGVSSRKRSGRWLSIYKNAYTKASELVSGRGKTKNRFLRRKRRY